MAHPLKLTVRAAFIPWMDDIWDRHMFDKQDTNYYWHSYRDVCFRVQACINEDPKLREMHPQTALSRTKNHHQKKDGGGVGIGWVYVLAQTADLCFVGTEVRHALYADTYCTGTYDYVCHRLLQ